MEQNDSIPQTVALRLPHDDDYFVYTHADTTLVLTTSTFVATQDNCKGEGLLLVYAETIVFHGDELKFPGREIHFHCNRVEWSGPLKLSLKGKSGDKTATVDHTDQSDGKQGGTLVLHVHDFPFTSTDKFWPDGVEIDVSGGGPGQYRESSTSDKFLDGNQGRDGKVERITRRYQQKLSDIGSAYIYYSNDLRRAAARLYDVYKDSKLSLPERLRIIKTEISPVLLEEYKRLKMTVDEVERLNVLVDGMLALFSVLAQIDQKLLAAKLPYATRQGSESIRERLKALQVLKDYGPAFPSIGGPAAVMLDALKALELAPNDNSSVLKQLAQSMTNLLKVLDSCTPGLDATAKGEPTELALVVKKIWEAVFGLCTRLEESVTASITMKHAPHVEPVTYTADSSEDLNLAYPLVHPDQCMMMLRQADALYFAGNTIDALVFYKYLAERLMFVRNLPPDLESVQNVAKDAPPLVKAFGDLESKGLSHWTLRSLRSMHSAIGERIDQVKSGTDLFKLTNDWAPRLSYRYYAESAQQQIERLKGYEEKYWDVFDVLQDQTKTVQRLEESKSLNVYRSTQIDEDIQRALEIITAKPKEIKLAGDNLKVLKKQLIKDLEAAKKEIDTWHWPDLNAWLTFGTSLVIIGVVAASAIATGGGSLAAVPLLTKVALGASTLTSVGQFGDEAYSKVKDVNGQKVDRKLVVTKLNNYEGDLKDMADTTFNIEKDGSISIREDDTQKIAITKQQLDGFLEQFKNQIPDAHKNLKDSVNKFFETSNKRNQDIITYTKAVISLLEKRRSRAFVDLQANRLGSESLKENIGLPSIVAFYQQLRTDSRMAILRSIKMSALALRFWGLQSITDFSGPGLLTNVDEMNAHVTNLFNKYEVTASQFASFAQSKWPSGEDNIGIIYKLSADELKALKAPSKDVWVTQAEVNGVNRVPRTYSVAINTLKSVAHRGTTVDANPFAGHSNIRISQVRVWIPGISLSSEFRPISIEIQHGGDEDIVDPDDVVHRFRHWPVHMKFEYKWNKVPSMEDIHFSKIASRQALASDWISANANTQVQAPVGAFTTWIIRLREAVNGPIGWSKVDAAYVEFCGSSLPFRL